MRVRVIRWTDPTSSVATLRVQRWCEGQWELVLEFGLHELERASDAAYVLSMSKRDPVELVVFEDGEKVVAPAVKSEGIIDQLLRENAAANAALPDYEGPKS